jgi:pSer/pThr/pTyr-binding forkhead associated (FHA) protein
MAFLVPKTGAQRGQEFPLAEGLNRVGRAPGNELRLDDPSISACHCELWLMKERLLVRDLASTNGTFVNGRPVSEAEISDSDTLSLGNVDFAIHGAPSKVAIPKPPAPLPPPPRFTPDGLPCCVNHWEITAPYRCGKCGEQFCPDCVRILGRRGGAQHAYCPLCNAECVKVVFPRNAPASKAGAGWLAKLTQTLRLRR